jgi:hypothetical protein
MSLVSISAVEDLACALPHLLGFHPVESLVLVAMSAGGGELTFTMRLDLPEPEDLAPVVEMCAARMEAAEADSVLAFVVTESPGLEPALPGADLVEALQRELPMPVRDAFLLRAGRIWSYLCPDPGCCPPDGRPIDHTSSVATTLAAAGVVAGRPVYAGREDVVREAQAVDGPAALSMAEAVARLRAEGGGEGRAPGELPDADVVRSRYAQAVPDLLARCAEHGPDLSHDEAALLGCGWHDLDLRDEMLMAVASDEPGADALVRAVARLMPAPYDAPAATMLAWLAYAEGSGVLAGAALDRALATDPAYSLARLLDDALGRQVPPSALRAVWTRFADDDPSEEGDRCPRRW